MEQVDKAVGFTVLLRYILCYAAAALNFCASASSICLRKFRTPNRCEAKEERDKSKHAHAHKCKRDKSDDGTERNAFFLAQLSNISLQMIFFYLWFCFCRNSKTEIVKFFLLFLSIFTPCHQILFFFFCIQLLMNVTTEIPFIYALHFLTISFFSFCLLFSHFFTFHLLLLGWLLLIFLSLI